MNFSDGPGIDRLIELMGFRLSTATVLFHAAIADRLGIGATDVKCYSILRQTGPISAGELADRVGLTTGAITGVVDRLERAGLAQRAPDPGDRRRVVLRLINDPERERAINHLYEPMGRAIVALATSYSAEERAIVVDFISKASAIMEEETARLRHDRSAAGGSAG